MLEELKFWFKFFWLWITNISVALDQLLNTILGGDPDETISSVVGKNREKWWAQWLAIILDYLDKRHTEKYKEHDEGKHSVWKLLLEREEEILDNINKTKTEKKQETE